MGFFDGRSDTRGDERRHHRSHSSSRSIFGSSSGHKHNSSGIFGSGSHNHNKSTSSFFSIGGGKSHRRASPRNGYLSRVYKQLQRLLRDLIYYLKKHPMKVFMLVIMPLITGGALTGLLRKFGLRLPMGMAKMFGSFGGTGIGRGAGGDLQFERTHYEGHGSSSGFGTAMNLAKLFM